MKVVATLGDMDGTWRRPTAARPYSEIYVSNRIGPHRRAFTVGHELLEANLPLSVPARHKEQWCNRGAAALMMPRREFLESGTACGWRIDVLREWWLFCSEEALERRMEELRVRLHLLSANTSASSC